MPNTDVKYTSRSYAPTLEKLERLNGLPADVIAESVDVAFREFMTAIHDAAARSSLKPTVTLGWLMTQLADAHAHWANDLGKRGFVVAAKTNPYLGKTFYETVKQFGKT
jgi:hypothetical protein